MKALRIISSLLVIGFVVSPAWADDAPSNKDGANVPGMNNSRGGLLAAEERIAALEAALAAAIAQINQLQSDLNAEVAAREAGDSAITAAFMSADAALQAQIDILNTIDVGAIDGRLSNVEETLTCVTYDVVAKDLIFVGCNVHVRDGSGLTQGTSGLGNLVVGYNLDTAGVLNRFGSHNVIIGDGQAYTTSGHLLTRSVGSSQDMTVTVGGNLSEIVSGNRSANVGSDSSVSVGSNSSVSVAGDSSINVGSDSSMTVGKNLTTNVGNDLTETVAGNHSTQSGKTMTLSGTDAIVLKSGSAQQIMQKNGDIDIKGKDVSIKASGTITLKGAKIVQN
ncbi:MAG: hypothetical protein AMS22_14705 [Thiotrichales bacterium SG8_50]|nr:MAG: hypothetical protein AMS22_14705 [Thiotrichales bacterium SG8_50]